MANEIKYYVYQSYLGKGIVNTFGFEGSDLNTLSVITAVGDEIKNLYQTHLQGQMTTAWSLVGVSYQDLTAPLQPILPITTTGFAGTNVGEPASARLAAKVAFGAATPRPNRAYKYLTGFSEDSYVSNTLNVVTEGFIAAWAQGLLDVWQTLTVNAFYSSVRVVTTPSYSVAANQLLTFTVRDSVRGLRKRANNNT